MEQGCRGWDIQNYCCFVSYSNAKGFPFWCAVHDCEAWDCFTPLPPPGGKPCPDCAPKRLEGRCGRCGAVPGKPCIEKDGDLEGELTHVDRFRQYIHNKPKK